MAEEVVKQKGLLRRGVSAEEIRIQRKEEKATTISFPASSEEPVERYWGDEVLSHEHGAVRMDRATRGAMPLLFNHDVDDPIGMITGARLEKNRLMVDAQLFTTARAQEVLTMIDGGLRNVSLAYRINKIEEDKNEERFTVTDWEPYEVSIVTVPADPTVGIGRGAELEYEVRMIRASHQAPQPSASELTSAATRRSSMDGDEKKETAPVAVVDDKKPNAAEIEAVRGQLVKQMERDRITAIENLCRVNQIDEKYKDHWIRSGMSMKDVSEDLLAIMEERGKHNPQSASKLGLSERETKKFSLVRAIGGVLDGWNNAPFELECSREIAKKLNKPSDPRRFFVPLEVQERANETPVEALVRMMAVRDLNVASAGAGGYLVQTSNVGFIDILRNTAVLFRMGARRLSGLRDNITIPKQTVAATTTWLASETAQISESTPTFVQIAMSPKTVGGYCEISRQLLLQSNPAAEGLVSADLAQVVALDIDLKGLNGSGASGQPTGILQTSGIGSVTGTSLDYADVIEFQTDVYGGNALTANCGYVTTGAVAGLLKARVKFSSTASPLWEGRLDEAMMDGYRAMSSNQMPSATMLFGDFGQVVVAEWGVLEVEVNPFADFKAGIIGVRAIASIDIAVRYPTAFSAASSIT